MGKLSDILTAVKIGSAVAKTIFTGKTAKVLERVDQGTTLAEQLKAMFPPKKEKPKK